MIRHRVRTARVRHICENLGCHIQPGRKHIESIASPDSDAGQGSWARFRLCAHCAERHELGHLIGPMHGPARQIGEHPTHTPCCSSHGVRMDCATYRRTHFVETRPCCDMDAKARPVVVVELPELVEAMS